MSKNQEAQTTVFNVNSFSVNNIDFVLQQLGYTLIINRE